jgi:hypothetical protein
MQQSQALDLTLPIRHRRVLQKTHWLLLSLCPAGPRPWGWACYWAGVWGDCSAFQVSPHHAPARQSLNDQ